MPESISTFTAGMNSDLSPTYQTKNSYTEAINIELLSTESQGSVAISNSKGNKLLFTLPTVSEIYKLTILAAGPTTITINGVVSATQFVATSASTIADLYTFINSDVNFDLTGVNIYYNDVKLIIVSTGQALTISVSDPLVIGGTTSVYIPSQSGVQPIGYGVINDDIYIFSTNCTDIDPQLNGGGYGQIWRLAYDNINFDNSFSTIDLIYSADLDFTTYFHIPQTGVVTRYENSTIQRVYWTDNYNRVRNINLKDPQAFTLDVSLLDLVSSVDFNVPILTEIQNGGVKTIKDYYKKQFYANETVLNILPIIDNQKFLIKDGVPFEINDFKIVPFEVYHDTKRSPPVAAPPRPANPTPPCSQTYESQTEEAANISSSWN